MKSFFLSTLLLFIASHYITAQDITYANVEKNDVLRMNFEILGKAADNYLIYKEAGGKHHISVYDHNMKLQTDIPISILPKRDNLLDISFFKSQNQYHLLYQYQESNVVYLKAASIEANGSIVSEPVILDTTMIAYKTENKIYSIINSNDNSKLLAFKVNKRDRSLFRITTKLYDGNLQLINEGSFTVPMEYKGDYLTGHSISNEGNYAFIKYHREANGNITSAALMQKTANDNDYQTHPLNINAIYLDDIKLMSDDENGRFLVSSLFSKQKRGDIDGVYVLGITKSSGDVAFEKEYLFSDDLKQKAKGRSNTKNAFNNFFINNIIVHSNGSFVIAAEALYNSDNWDRWGLWGNPGFGPGFGPGWGWGAAGLWGGGWGLGWGWNRWGGWWPYSYYSPFFYRSYWWGGWGPSWSGGGSQRFNAGNIAIISFDENGNKTWDKVIVKSQSENNTDGAISYQVISASNNMYFIMNNAAKLSHLENFAITNDGEVQKGPGIPAKEKRIDFMPKYGRQTGPQELIVPYQFKNNISFAKVTL